MITKLGLVLLSLLDVGRGLPLAITKYPTPLFALIAFQGSDAGNSHAYLSAFPLLISWREQPHTSTTILLHIQVCLADHACTDQQKYLSVVMALSTEVAALMRDTVVNSHADNKFTAIISTLS